ncbi:hypothetical protein SSX86_026065 [Deinandra increscens subsp. villosa]|uniref:RRM domain-containing protein n=1 Tax=Deinandra increscens subsp. villosa TaxID=3103831 RepID=A0AAP0CE80_9ASTR
MGDTANRATRVSPTQGNSDEDGDGQHPWETMSGRRNQYRATNQKKYGSIGENKLDSRWENTDLWSTTVFVTNFPVSTTKLGLKVTCSAAGKVLDVFIPNRLNVMGKRYAFVRFSKSADVRSLIVKIRSLWIGNFRLFADESRFKRGIGVENKLVGDAKKASDVDLGNGGNGRVVHGSKSFSYAQVTKVGVGNRISASKTNSMVDGEIFDDALVLEEDLSSSLLVKIREFSLFSKVYLHAHNEGFSDVSFRHLDKIRETVNFQVKGKCYKVDITELHAWSPSFEYIGDDNNSSEEEEELLDHEELEINVNGKEVKEKSAPLDQMSGVKDSDPFRIMETIRALDTEKKGVTSSSESLSKPPGFSKVNEPVDVADPNPANVSILEEDGVAKVVICAKEGEASKCDFDDVVTKPVVGDEVSCNKESHLHGMHVRNGNFHSSVSLLEEFERLIDRGLAYGVDMEGSKKDLVNLINRMSDAMGSR